MKLCRFQNSEGQIRVGLMQNGTTVLDLTAAGIDRLETALEQHDPHRFLKKLSGSTFTAHLLSKVKLLTPVARQEVWAGRRHLPAKQKGAHGGIEFQRDGIRQGL